MAARVWYLHHGYLDPENLYPQLDYSQGWTVDKKGSGNYCRIYANTIRPYSDFVTTEYTGSPTEGPNNVYWGGYQNTGTYDAGDWVFAFKVRCNAYYAQQGYLKMRLWKFDKTDYTTYTEITSGWVSSALITFTAANQYKTGTITWTSPSAVELTDNDGIVLDIEWACSASGGNNAAIVYFCEGESSGETLTSPNFTPAGAGSTWAYAGEVPAALTPESTLKLIKKYSTGELPASLLPESALKLIKAYAGEVQAQVTPEHGLKVTLCPLTEAAFSFGLEGVYAYVLPEGIFVYDGEVPVGVLPEHAVSALYSPPGEIGMSMAAEHAVKLLWQPTSEVQASLAPEHQLKAIMVPAVELSTSLALDHTVSRLWAPPVAGCQFSTALEHAESFLRTFTGEIPLAAVPVGAYSRGWDAGAGLIALTTSLEGVIKLIRAYSGEVQTGLSPEHSESVARAHEGEVALALVPEHQFGRIAVFIGGIAFDLGVMGLSTFQLLGRSQLELNLFSWVEAAHYSFTPVRLYKGPHGTLVHCPLTSIMSLIPNIRAAAKEEGDPSAPVERMDDPHGPLIHCPFTSIMALDPGVRATMVKIQHDTQGE